MWYDSRIDTVASLGCSPLHCGLWNSDCGMNSNVRSAAAAESHAADDRLRNPE
jgi:hypothetical protein